MNEGLNRNLDNKPWSPGSHPEENFGWEKKDDRQILIDLDGSYPEEKLGWENRT